MKVQISKKNPNHWQMIASKYIPFADDFYDRCTEPSHFWEYGQYMNPIPHTLEHINVSLIYTKNIDGSDYIRIVLNGYDDSHWWKEDFTNFEDALRLYNCMSQTSFYEIEELGFKC